MMKRNSIHSMLSVLLCIVLIAALALFAAGCTDGGNTNETTETTETIETAETTASTAPAVQATVLGEGANVFTFTVVDPEGAETVYEIHTDETVVGDALIALELLEGEEGPYGLYVKTVNGTTLDYETDGMYWGFYIDGEYALTGVDTTEITAGVTYTFQADAA